MYKHAKSQRPDGQDREPVYPEWAVVAFRWGRDNHRRPRVYRRVWTFRSELAALAWLATVDRRVYEEARLVRSGRLVDTSEVGAIVTEWCQSRRGVNAGVDPWSGGRYLHRECGGDDRYDEELIYD